MSVSLVIFIIIHIAVFGYFIELLRRVAIRTREYPLEDSPETLPFRMVSLRTVVISYIFWYIVWFIFSIWLYVTFISGYSNVDTGGINTVNSLNL